MTTTAIAIRRRCLRLLLATAIFTIAAASGAWAHGDPASHYLETDALYPGYASQPSVEVQLKLLGLLQESERRGYPIKVALVAGAEDLVDDLAMLRTPQSYAESVAAAIEQELAAPVLIVTPYGLGVSGNLRRLLPAALVRGIAVRGPSGDELARTAMTAVRRIARAGGHPLPARVAPAEQYVPPVAVAPPGAAAEAPLTEPAGGTSALLTALPAALVALAFLVGYLRSRRRGAAAQTVAPAPEIG